MEHKKTTLYIPDNIKTGFEFFQGFGWREMIYGLIMVGIALAAAFIWNGIDNSDLGFFRGVAMVVLTAAVAFGLFRKDNLNQSMIDHWRRFLKFKKEQQKYKYRHYDPFKGGDF